MTPPGISAHELNRMHRADLELEIEANRLATAVRQARQTGDSEVAARVGRRLFTALRLIRKPVAG